MHGAHTDTRTHTHTRTHTRAAATHCDGAGRSVAAASSAVTADRCSASNARLGRCRRLSAPDALHGIQPGYPRDCGRLGRVDVGLARRGSGPDRHRRAPSRPRSTPPPPSPPPPPLRACVADTKRAQGAPALSGLFVCLIVCSFAAGRRRRSRRLRRRFRRARSSAPTRPALPASRPSCSYACRADASSLMRAERPWQPRQWLRAGAASAPVLTGLSRGRARTHARAHTRTHAHTNTHTHTRARARALFRPGRVGDGRCEAHSGCRAAQGRRGQA